METYFKLIPPQIGVIIYGKLKFGELINMIKFKSDAGIFKELFRYRYPAFFNVMSEVLKQNFYQYLEIDDCIYNILYIDYLKNDDIIRHALGRRKRYKNQIFTDVGLNIRKSISLYNNYPFLYKSLDTMKLYKAMPIIIKDLLTFSHDEYSSNVSIIIDLAKTGELLKPLIFNHDHGFEFSELDQVILLYILIKLSYKNTNIMFDRNYTIKFMDALEDIGTDLFSDDITTANNGMLIEGHMIPFIISMRDNLKYTDE